MTPDVTDVDLHLLETGRHLELHDRLGAHVLAEGGVRFAVWAPSALAVSVVGDWNHWVVGEHRMHRSPWDDAGVWEVTLPFVDEGHRYKFAVTGPDGTTVEHADPLAFRSEGAPSTASIVHRHQHRWGDQGWMDRRRGTDPWTGPMSIYEVHAGSWRRDPAEPERERTFREIAPELAAYVTDLGFSHVELMPVMGHPFGGSWGYQVTSFFAPAARWGTPEDLAFLIDTLHQAGIGVILDWVPAHFPKDEWALARFDGTA
ncbi:MAG: 1,4-alpha-glucan branching enzyme, partial [Acidimicrobiales bacterium]|nr:1,4-alpha-glucan branching enzyme [Acidimicrobiales bacterium]